MQADKQSRREGEAEIERERERGASKLMSICARIQSQYLRHDNATITSYLLCR